MSSTRSGPIPATAGLALREVPMSPGAAIATSAAGHLVAAGLVVLATPLLIILLGIEGYGLISAVATLQAICMMLDLGTAMCFTREVARSGAGEVGPFQIWALARRLEGAALSLAVLLGLAVIVAAPWLARRWLQPGAITVEKAELAIRLGGVALACHFPSVVYAAGLAGMQRFAVLGLLHGLFGALRTFGILAVLWLTGPRLTTYFVLLVLASVIHTLLLRQIFWQRLRRAMPEEPEGRGRLRAFVRLAASNSAATLTGIMLLQADKVIVSKLLPLREFGYYMLATVLSGSIGLLVTPVISATFPRLSRLADGGEPQALAGVYHAASQLLAVIAIPVGVTLALYPEQVLYAWTGSTAAAAAGGPLLRLLAVANAIAGSLLLLNFLELAEGRTAPAVWLNLAALAVMVPLTLALVARFGAIGAAAGWLIHNVLMLLLRPPITHLGLAAQDRRAWYLEDIGPAFLAVVLAGLVLQRTLPLPTESRLALILVLGIAWLILTLAAVLASWRVRRLLAAMSGDMKAWLLRR